MMRPVSVHVTSIAPTPSTASGGRNVEDPTTVTLTWNDTTPVDYQDPTTWGDRSAEIGYRIERATITWRGHTGFETVGTAVANATTYTDTTAQADGVYLYRVTSWNEGGSSPSNQITVLSGSVTPTSVTVASDANPAVLDDPVTFTATVSSPIATGTIDFAVDGAVEVTVPVVDGTATFTPASLAIGDHDVVATYSGDADFAPSMSDVFVQTVTGWPTALALRADHSPSVHGERVRFTATVDDTRQTHGVPTGSVRFTITAPDGTTTSTVLPLSGTGSATLSISTLELGDNTVLAEFLPTGSFEPSSDRLVHAVHLRPTTTVVSSNPARVLFGSPVTFTATVRTSGLAMGVPTGAVTFTIAGSGGAPIVSTVPLNGAGTASHTVADLAPGTHSITATFEPTGVFAASEGSMSQSVIGRPTTTTLNSNRNPNRFGQQVVLTAVVRSVTASDGVPAGSVQFAITSPSGATTYVTAALSKQGTATYTSSALQVGTHRVTAAYVPSGGFGHQPSTATIQQAITRGTSTVSVTTSTTRTRRGQSVTLTARISPTVARGTVQFTVNGAPFGAPVPVGANGRATLTTTALPVGTLAIRAAYGGDANLFGATSSPVIVTVR